MLLIVLLQASTDVSGLISLYREVGAMLVGIGFVCAGLSVLKKLITNHEKTKEAIITYIVALVVWLLIWSLIRCYYTHCLLTWYLSFCD